MSAENKEFAFIAALIVVLALLAAKLIAKDRQEWSTFAAKHQCRIVAQRQGSTATAVGFTGNGDVTITPISAPAQEAWLCDDGVTYWRNK